MPTVMSLCQLFGCGVGGSSGGAVPNKLIADYEGEWEYIDGVEYGGYEFGPQRTFRGATLVAPSTGVAYLMGNPSHTEVMLAAATVGYEPNDTSITIWAATLIDVTTGTTVIEPANGDFIELSSGDGRWRILSYRRVMDGAQWRCMVRKTVL